MEIIPIIIIAAITFGICFLVDKGFTKLFRSQAQHHSGKAVRLNKKFGAFGLILFILGLAAIFAGLNGELIMTIGGSLIILVGIGLVVYYMTFGVFYDEDGFVLTTFGKKSTLYAYKDITTQQLFTSGNNIIVELSLKDGRSIHFPTGAKDVYPFLDYAFSRWCAQKGLDPENCPFHDPDNHLWFPMEEES